VEQNVDIGGEVVVDHIGLDELHVVVEILGRPEIGVVDGDHVVVGREPVREIRADKARATRHENALIVHECVYSRLGNYRFGFIHLKNCEFTHHGERSTRSLVRRCNQ